MHCSSQFKLLLGKAEDKIKWHGLLLANVYNLWMPDTSSMTSGDYHFVSLLPRCHIRQNMALAAAKQETISTWPFHFANGIKPTTITVEIPADRQNLSNGTINPSQKLLPNLYYSGKWSLECTCRYTATRAWVACETAYFSNSYLTTTTVHWQWVMAFILHKTW